MEKNIDHKKQGKRNRAAGKRFELKVRADLEEKWIVDKWSNNVEFSKEIEEIQSKKMPTKEIQENNDYLTDKIKNAFKGKLVKVKNKFRGPGIPMMLGAGFPDFICFIWGVDGCKGYADVIGVESKMNGILREEEKQKCKWLLDNNIFSKILIASKGTKRGQIEYTDFLEKYPKV